MGFDLDQAYKVAETRGREDDTGQLQEITELWFVRVAWGEGIDKALDGTDLPASNEAHPTYSHLRVLSRVPALQPDGQKWTFEIKYGLRNEQQEDYQFQFIDYGTHELQQDVTHNLGTGTILLDANGKPFSDTFQVPRSYPWIKIVKKQNNVNRDDVINLSGTINDASITVAGVTFAKHTCRIRMNAHEVDEKLYQWEISYEVMVRYFTVSNYIDFTGALQAGAFEFGWDEGVINQGFYYYSDGSDLTRATEIIKKASGEEQEVPSATPVLLDENGERLAEGGTPISIQTQVYPEADWSGLGLNTL